MFCVLLVERINDIMKKVKLPLCPNPIMNTCAHGHPIHLITKKDVKHYLVCDRETCVYDEALKAIKKINKLKRLGRI